MRRMVLGAVALMTVSVTAAEGRGGALFKVVSSKDEVTIGMAQETDVERMAKQLVRDGYVRAWQYVPARGDDGAIVQKPQHEIVILAAQTVRIEPIAATQSVVAPPR